MMRLIFGLGNPGKDFHLTRHNVGFIILDYISRELHQKFNKTKFRSVYCTYHHGEQKWLLVKPETYMNLCGVSVNA